MEVRGVTMGKYKIFVDGSSGTTGLRIADRLAERDEFEILKISEEDRKESVERSVNEALKAYGEVIPGISVYVRKGVPYAEIVDFAKEKNADMVMIGHRGLSNLERFFIGSVAAKVVAHAPCSVYVLRPKEKAGA